MFARCSVVSVAQRDVFAEEDWVILPFTRDQAKFLMQALSPTIHSSALDGIIPSISFGSERLSCSRFYSAYDVLNVVLFHSLLKVRSRPARQHIAAEVTDEIAWCQVLLNEGALRKCDAVTITSDRLTELLRPLSFDALATSAVRPWNVWENLKRLILEW